MILVRSYPLPVRTKTNLLIRRNDLIQGSGAQFIIEHPEQAIG